MEILVDHRPAWTSLPRALREEGHKVLSVDPVPGRSCSPGNPGDPGTPSDDKTDTLRRIVVCKNPLDESV
jgi:hypothetical protein